MVSADEATKAASTAIDTDTNFVKPKAKVRELVLVSDEGGEDSDPITATSKEVMYTTSSGGKDPRKATRTKSRSSLGAGQDHPHQVLRVRGPTIKGEGPIRRPNIPKT